MSATSPINVVAGPAGLPVRTKLATAFGVLALMVAGVSVIALNALGNANATLDGYVNGMASTPVPRKLRWCGPRWTGARSPHATWSW